MADLEFIKTCPECKLKFTTTCRNRILCGSDKCRHKHNQKLYATKNERRTAAHVLASKNLQKRRCLKCEEWFGSYGPGNRLCPICQGQNFKHGDAKIYWVAPIMS